MAFDAFKCGTVAAFPTLLSTDETCMSSLDQTQKIALSMNTVSGFGIDSQSAATYIKNQAAWTAKITAGLRLTPYVTDFTITPGDFQEDANENNLNGIPQYIGNSFTVVEFNLKSTTPALITKLEQLTVLSSKDGGITQIKGYFLGRNSRITSKATGDGIPIYNFTIKDVSSAGRNQPNVWACRFYLLEDWSKEIETFDAAFDPMTLSNPAS